MISIMMAAAASAGIAAPTSFDLRKSSTVAFESSFQDYGEAGKQREVESRIKLLREDVTIVIIPALGSRRIDGRERRGAAIGGDLYVDLGPSVASRTSVQVATRTPAFARIDASQTLTIGIAEGTNAQIGARYARYHGGNEVLFGSAGLRRYFPFGSLAYTLTAAKLVGGKTGLGHMIQGSINDGRGGGYTQLWLAASKGAQEFDWAGDDRSKTRSAVVRRVQPISAGAALVAKLGIARYERPADRHTGVIGGFGIEFRMP